MLTIWTVVDDNTWELDPKIFFLSEEDAVAAAELGAVIVGIDICDSGSEMRKAVRKEKSR